MNIFFNIKTGQISYNNIDILTNKKYKLNDIDISHNINEIYFLKNIIYKKTQLINSEIYLEWKMTRKNDWDWFRLNDNINIDDMISIKSFIDSQKQFYLKEDNNLLLSSFIDSQEQFYLKEENNKLLEELEKYKIKYGEIN